ncbi:hypothetical protein LTS15_009969 [Exophiala xenobiotica]|nr:hypothetical protein LTS15_009969 [Exophiala xenobiotica]
MAGRKMQQPLGKHKARARVTTSVAERLRKGLKEPLEELPWTSFSVLKLSPEKLSQFPMTSRQWRPHVPASEKNEDDEETNSSAQNVAPAAEEWTPEPANDGAQAMSPGPPRANHPKSKGKSRLHTPAHHTKRRAKSILSTRKAHGRQTSAAAASKPPKRVRLAPEPEVLQVNGTYVDSDEENNEPQPSSDDTKTDGYDLIPSYDHDAPREDDEMSDAARKPQLKLKLSKPQIPPAGAPPLVQTPLSSSAARTPSIKLKLGTPVKGPENAPKPAPSNTIAVGASGSSSTKKRKKIHKPDDSEDELAGPAHKPVIRKITLNTPSLPAPPPKPTTAPTLFKLKAKGKAPKRPIGVGYDSELDEREADPMIHEGFVLRMQPGPDCDYLRKAIEDGTVHLPRSKGGADVKMRMLDTLGRRGILIIRGNQYAITMVDLPCIIEGMKSWDKKGWIKSIDVCQMLLVLGRCNTDEEARNYPLPEDVDPENYQYAHGLTAPMKWVRKRRFARTKRTRVDDIESVERRVKALLEADKAANSVRYQLLDHDPRLDEERYSSGLGEDEDAEAEEDDEMDGYFSLQGHQHAPAVETPMYTETPVEDIGQDEVDEFERMFAGEDEPPAVETAVQARSTLHVPDVGDSSFAVTSTSASPSATQAHTPASGAEQSSDEDEDDEGGEEDEDLDDAEKEGDENLQQVKDRIEDLQQKIAEQTELLKKTQNAILKKKLARKIQDLKDDVAMMKKNAGLGGDEDDD